MSFHDTIFRQILQLIPRYEFEKIVKSEKGDFANKGFSCWNQFSAMLFAQLSGQTGLRGIENGLELQSKKLYHLGISKTKRSTLSYANNIRPNEIYEKLFYSLLSKLHSKHKNHKFRFKNPLYSVDASTIDLCLNMFDWAHFRKKKGGIKLHVTLDHSSYIPSFVTVTDAKVHESNEIKNVPFKKDDVIVFDRGYTDYQYYSDLSEEGIYFVTRLKKNAKYSVLDDKDVSKYENILSEKIIVFDKIISKKGKPLKLRLVESYDPDLKKSITLITNNFSWSPRTISAIYKDRWQIEIFFKTIKQNLKIKSFLGTSRNAVLTQVWIVTISFLLLKYMEFQSTLGWTVSSIMAILSTILFANLNLFDWLTVPPDKQAPQKSYLLQKELF
ncbi:IS4 family transposase [Thiospirochaeta perfilievii]|uniref:IS4 family transposase n=1 Tax=Thiospirochaeta perfilievii TaxID=252967 RepID=A0A5C1Q8E3_9SPIO|nr:IS4 family transposase [Thiospirochaeta perfilievii]QEN04353.1 IS4 family transposase [Thiospirochaeta perfilievii]